MKVHHVDCVNGTATIELDDGEALAKGSPYEVSAHWLRQMAALFLGAADRAESRPMPVKRSDTCTASQTIPSGTRIMGDPKVVILNLTPPTGPSGSVDASELDDQAEILLYKRIGELAKNASAQEIKDLGAAFAALRHANAACIAASRSGRGSST